MAVPHDERTSATVETVLQEQSLISDARRVAIDRIAQVPFAGVMSSFKVTPAASPFQQ